MLSRRLDVGGAISPLSGSGVVCSPIAHFLVDYDPDGVFGDVVNYTSFAVVYLKWKTFLNGSGANLSVRVISVK